jgi:hypothetical protein
MRAGLCLGVLGAASFLRRSSPAAAAQLLDPEGGRSTVTGGAWRSARRALLCGAGVQVIDCMLAHPQLARLLAHPSVSYGTSNLYMRGVLEEETRPNLSKRMTELMELEAGGRGVRGDAWWRRGRAAQASTGCPCTCLQRVDETSAAPAPPLLPRCVACPPSTRCARLGRDWQHPPAQSSWPAPWQAGGQAG